MTPTFTEKTRILFVPHSLFVFATYLAQHHCFTVILCILFAHVHAVDEKSMLFKVQGIKAKKNQLQHGQWHQARFISTSESGLKKWEGIEVSVSVGFCITMKNIHVNLMIFWGSLWEKFEFNGSQLEGSVPTLDQHTPLVSALRLASLFRTTT